MTGSVKASPLDQLAADAAEMGVCLDKAALDRFSIYLTLLQKWGKKINLTTRLDSEEIVVYHVLDSLAGVPVFAESAGDKVVDLGSGAGLPSFPLKFALPGLRLLLVESVGFSEAEIRRMTATNPAALFGLPG